MKKIISAGLFVGLALIATTGFANENQERIYLVQILNQLNSIQPFIVAAAKEQPKNARIQFHYTRYSDQEGHLHNGLLEDIQAIQAGIKQKLNLPTIEPRIVTPITGDYLDNKNNRVGKK